VRSDGWNTKGLGFWGRKRGRIFLFAKINPLFVFRRAVLSLHFLHMPPSADVEASSRTCLQGTDLQTEREAPKMKHKFMTTPIS